MKNQPFLKAFTLLVFLSIFSCEDQLIDQVVASDESKDLFNTFDTRKVSINEIPEISQYLESQTGKELFTFNRKGNVEGVIFDVENILQVIDTINRINYSFNFILPNSDPNEMYNLIVGLDSLGQKTTPVVLKYTCEPESMENWVENDFDFNHFKGTVDFHKFTDFFSENLFSKTECPPEHDQYGDPIPCQRDNFSDGSGGGASTGGGAGGSPSSPGGCTYNAYWSSCGGSNQYTTHGSGSCGGDGNGSGWVIEITCPNGNNSNTKLFKSTTDTNCPGCDTGPSGGAAINIGNLSKPIRKVDYYLLGSLSDPELLWLMGHPDETEQIVDYFLAEGRTDETRTFAIKALLAMSLGFSVDFEDEIINALTGKAKCVYDKLENQNSNLFKNTIGMFIDDPEYDLTLLVADCNSTNDACTDANDVNDIKIKIEDLNQSSLGIAALILHEGIHAELHRYVSRFKSGVDPNNRPRLLQLYAYYKGWSDKIDNPGYSFTNDAHHVYMVENYIKPIALAIRNLDGNRYPLSHYMAYGWDGLEDTGYKSKKLNTNENSTNQDLKQLVESSFAESCQ